MDKSLDATQVEVNTQQGSHQNGAAGSQTGYNTATVTAFLESLDHRSVGGVTEIRIIPKAQYLHFNGIRKFVGKTVVGYYEPAQYAQAAKDIAPFDGQAQIYVTLNACKPELLARSANRLQINAQHTAADADIPRLQWFRIDCDPVRSSGISANEKELEKALSCRDVIAADLETFGAQVIKAMSGNGGHLLVRLPDYPNDTEHRALIDETTKSLAAQWSDEAVTVDTTVTNPSRIWKVYGTLATKGDHLPDRPHRRATIDLPTTSPTPFDIRLLPREAIAPVHEHKQPEANGHHDTGNAYVQAALRGELKKLTDTPDGQKHSALLRSATALARFLPSGVITAQTIEDQLFAAVRDRAEDPKKALKTIQDGIRYGSSRPRSIPDAKSQHATRTTLKNLNNPQEGSSLGSLGRYPDDFKNFQTDPQPLVPKLRPVPRLRSELLPGALRTWLVDSAERMNAPLEFVAAPALVALASLIGRKVGIRPKQFDDWTVVANLWGATIGSPGQRKTPAATEALKPLLRLEAEAIEAHKRAIADFSVEIEVAAAQNGAAKDALKRAAKNKDTSSAELRQLAEQSKPTEQNPPTEKRYKVNDTTVEALGERLRENQNGLLLYRDELSGFLNTLDKQGHESDRKFYLQSWNGTEENYHYDRIGRGVVRLPTMCLSIFGTIQPGPLSRLLRGAANGEEADGLIQRFQLMLYPDALTYRHIDRWPDTEAKNRAFAVFMDFDSLDAAAIGAESQEGHSIPFLRFTPQAQQYFDRWITELESVKLPAAQGTPLIESHLAKYRSLMPSLALLFHLVETLGTGQVGPVPLEAAQMAADWCALLEEHARRVYQLAYDGSLDSAASLVERIKDGSVAKLRTWDGMRFKVGDIVQHGWSSLSTTEDVNRAVAVLEALHWVQFEEEPSQTGVGRPSQWVYLHPKLTQGRREEA